VLFSTGFPGFARFLADSCMPHPHLQGFTGLGAAERAQLLYEPVTAIPWTSNMGKTIMRDYIKATVGFEKLGAATGASPKSLIRMFGPRGNPQAKNLFSVIGYLQKRASLRLHVGG
jgi:hypothetical protein